MVRAFERRAMVLYGRTRPNLPASRKESREIYVVAQGFRGAAAG